MVTKTDQSAENARAWLRNVRVVLVEPLKAGNVGSVCRAMANMGLSDLALVTPRDLGREARWMACHADGILENHTEWNTLAEAIHDCGAVIGSSAREGLYRQHAQTPRDWAPRVLESARTGKVALVFGREDSGLSNEELALCTHVARIPSTEEYRSLNLAQAVMIFCYEIFVAANIYEPPREKSAEAPSALRERMMGLWRDLLLDIGFMEPAKADHMMFGLRRVLSRGAWTVDDVNIMMGVARQAAWATRKRTAVAADETTPAAPGREEQ
jgi:tRNA/rRNA methyltransferase